MFSKGKKTSFDVQKGAVVGNFENATTPLVWRADLARLQSVSVKLIKGEGAWDLTLVEPKNQTEIIASFSSQTAGEQALQAFAKAMRARSLSVLVVKGLLSLLAGLALIVSLMVVGPKASSLFLDSKTEKVETIRQDTGKGVSADDVLQMPSP